MMTPKIRLEVLAIIILLSAVYGILVSKDTELARTIAIGYIAIVLTVFALVRLWRKA